MGNMHTKYSSVRTAKNSLASPTEDDEQELVVKFINYKYKDWIYQVNWLSGCKLPIGLAVKAKRKGHQKSIPDIMIFEPRGDYHGLFIELKRKGSKTLKRNGEVVSPHLAEQLKTLSRLHDKGYAAVLSCGYHEAVDYIAAYAELKPFYANQDNALSKQAYTAEELSAQFYGVEQLQEICDDCELSRQVPFS